MNIIGTENLTIEQIHSAVERGAKFVVFQYCVSVIFMTFKRSSDVYLIRPGHTALAPRVGFSIITLALGWWGFPWGPIYSVQALWNNAIGGIDLTPEMLARSPSPATAQGGPPVQDKGGNTTTMWEKLKIATTIRPMKPEMNRKAATALARIVRALRVQLRKEAA